MAVFQYQAIGQQGNAQHGMLEGESARAVRQQLRQQGLTPLHVQRASGDRFASLDAKQTLRFKRVSKKTLALLTRQLASLIGGGIPIVEALSAVAEQSEQTAVKQRILAVRDSVREGFSLSQALQDQADLFSTFYIAAVQAGESSGHLDVILIELADYLEREQAIRLKVQQALVYPSIVSIVCIAIIVFLLVYVVPSMVHVFVSMHQTLPTMTQVLIAISTFVSTHGVVLLGMLLLFAYGGRFVLRQASIRYWLDSTRLTLPLVKRLVILLNVGRFVRTLGMLVGAGVPLVEALRISSGLLQNQLLRRAFEKAREQVREGESLQQSFKKVGYIPPMTLHFVASGEASGQLPEMLERAAAEHDREFNRFVDIALTLFEPVMILCMGGIVLFIVLAVLLPIFSMDQMIQLS